MKLTASQMAANIRGALSRMNVSLSEGDKNIMVAVAVGRAISSHLPIPSCPVPNADLYFSERHDRYACEIIEHINDAFILDVRLAREMAFKFFKFRYDLVHSQEAFTQLFPYMGDALAQILPDRVTHVLAIERSVVDYNTISNNWSYLIRTITNEVERVDTTEMVTPSSAAVGYLNG